MKIGLQINRFTWPGGDEKINETLRKITTTADTAEFYSLWVMDHYFQITHVGIPEEPMLEAYTTLGFLAGITKRAKLGAMVTGVIYRHPALLIKAVTTLDVLSQGRAYFGVGAGWNEEECIGLGFPFPAVKERFELLEETLNIALQMWKGDESPFTSKHITAQRPLNHPQALSKPHPPILIGGGGEQKTLRLVAKYADACNLFPGPEMNHKLEVLKRHCEDVGRNYNDIEKTCMYQIREESGVPDARKIIEVCKKMREKEFTQIIFGIRNSYQIDPLKVFGEKIIPEVTKL